MLTQADAYLTFQIGENMSKASFEIPLNFRANLLCQKMCHIHTCENIKLKDGSLSSNEEEHWAIWMLPEGLIHKEPLEVRTAERAVRKREGI